MNRFSLTCEVFHKDLDLNKIDEPTYIDKSIFKSMAQEAQQRILELVAIRSGYQQIMDVYKDQYQ